MSILAGGFGGRAVCATAIGALALFFGGVTTGGAVTLQVKSAGTATLRAGPTGSDAFANPEFDEALGALEASGEDLSADVSGGRVVNRTIATKHGKGHEKKGGKKAKSNPELKVSFDGLNFRQQRLANGGNQFSVEPPDQALCVGNGFVLEAVNDVIRVFDANGNPLMGVVDLNTFYGYPAAINRSTGAQGPSITDPVCHYDADTQRWFVAVLTLDHIGTTGALHGNNHLDVAVSATASPLGTWNIYRLPVQNDGSDGTPNHNCDGGPCLGDYPHIGADANGIYLTTNEFALFGDGYYGAQIYAASKRALARGDAVIQVVQFNTSDADFLLPPDSDNPDGSPGFTVWPAISPDREFAKEEGGTQYFLSSQAVFNSSGEDNRLRIWALTNTKSLDKAVPDLALNHGIVKVDDYSVPLPANQKAGDFPLGQCINNTDLFEPGIGCWAIFFGAEPAHDEVISHPDSQDSRMQQVSYANGKLWGALGTGAIVEGKLKTGIAYYVIDPKVSKKKVEGKVKMQGTLALADNHLTYPTVAVLKDGRGVIGFTVMGDDHYPSAGYAGLDDKIGAGEIHIAAEGLGPHDGFTGYKAFVGDPPRTRWGDYGAAATDGKTIWFASEYIAQTCTLAQYLTGAIGSCGGTRTSLGNWATRITQVDP